MKPRLMWVSVALAAWALAGCATQAGLTLVGTDPVYDYFQSAFGAEVLGRGASTPQSAGAMMVAESLFDEFAGDYRGQTATELPYEYSADQFVFYRLSLNKEVPLRSEAVRFSLLDRTGEEIVTDSRGVVLAGYVQLPNSYVKIPIFKHKWLVRLRRPFTKENFAEGEYVLSIQYPSGQMSQYSLQPR